MRYSRHPAFGHQPTFLKLSVLGTCGWGTHGHRDLTLGPEHLQSLLPTVGPGTIPADTEGRLFCPCEAQLAPAVREQRPVPPRRPLTSTFPAPCFCSCRTQRLEHPPLSFPPLQILCTGQGWPKHAFLYELFQAPSCVILVPETTGNNIVAL